MKKYDHFDEPNLDTAMILLKQKDGYQAVKEDVEKLYLMLYYFEEDQTESFFKKISMVGSKDEFNTVFQNLVHLYPLSKHIIMKIIGNHPLNKEDELTGDFLDVYEQAEGLAAVFEGTIREIKNQRKNLPLRIQKCDERIERYTKEKEQSQAQLNTIREKESKENALLKEVTALEQEVRQLNLKYSQQHLKEQQKELQNAKAECEKNKLTYDKAAKEIEAINREIERHSKEVYQQNLTELSNKSKGLSDNEDI